MRGMKRIDLGVLGAVKIVDVVALNRLIEKREPERKHQRDQSKRARYHCTGMPGFRVHTSVSG
jgi:hypothetical protein